MRFFGGNIFGTANVYLFLGNLYTLLKASGPKRRPVQDPKFLLRPPWNRFQALTPPVTWKLNSHGKEFQLNGHNMSCASDEDLALKYLAFESHYVGSPVHVMDSTDKT